MAAPNPGPPEAGFGLDGEGAAAGGEVDGSGFGTTSGCFVGNVAGSGLEEDVGTGSGEVFAGAGSWTGTEEDEGASAGGTYGSG